MEVSLIQVESGSSGIEMYLARSVQVQLGLYFLIHWAYIKLEPCQVELG